MKIKKLNIVKRAVPVLISAIAVSALYTSHSFAGTNTIPWSDVMLGDSLSIGAGYYEDDTVIQIPTKQQVIERHEINIDDLVEYDDTLEGISSLTASYYSSGNNDTLGVGITSSSGSKDVALSTTGASDLNLGINESITLPSGYYANPITIKNGVANRGSIAKTLESSETYSLPEGYYESIIIQAPTVASAIQFSNNLNFTISKNFSGSWYNGNHSEEYYYNYTVPQTGLLVYSFASKGGTYDENPKYIRTWGEMTCSVESGSFVHQGDVITFGIFRKYSGSSTEYAPDAGGTITVFLMY